MVAALGLLQHGEVFLHLGLVFDGGAVDALKLGIVFVTLVVGAGDVSELEGPDVAGAHDVRAGAEIGKVPVFVQGDDFALGDALDDIAFELRGFGTLGQGGEASLLRKGDGVVAGNLGALKRVVRLDLLFHLLLEAGEILRGNAVRKFDVVIKTVLHRRTGGKLRLGPDFQDGRGQHVRGGVADAFEFSHGEDHSREGAKTRRN